MSRVWCVSLPHPLRFPRVSGDEPQLLDDTNYGQVFSPRERG